MTEPDIPFHYARSFKRIILYLLKYNIDFENISYIMDRMLFSRKNRIEVPRVVLHIGLHKTGTTTIQKNLSANRSALNAMGIGVILHEDIKALSSYVGFKGRKNVKRGYSKKFSSELFKLAKNQQDIVSSLGLGKMKQLIISEEEMTGTRMPGIIDYPICRPRMELAIEHILTAFDTDTVHISLYVRRQDTFVESSYLWEIQKMKTHDISEQFPYLDKPQFSYTNLIERLEKISHYKSIRVRPFEIISKGTKFYVEDFLKNLELPQSHELSLKIVKEHANASLSQRSFEIALLTGQYFETEIQIKKFRRFLKKTFPSSEYDKATIFSDERRAALVELYREDNEKMFAKYMRDLPVDTYSTTAGTKALRNLPL